MTDKKDNTIVAEGLAAQRKYIARREQQGAHFSLMVADAFVRGIRDLGYKSAATAIDELIDNSIQANAQHIHVAFGYAKAGVEKPNSIAVLDDGHGMDATMIRAAVMWGGTHREDDRTGFGRFGFGLPSASVSIGKRFTVYAWTIEGSVNSVTIDIDEIGEGKHRDERGEIAVPLPVSGTLPDWISTYYEKHFPGKRVPKSGTVVVVEKPDRLKWKTTKSLQEKLSEHFSVIYRNYLRGISLGVNGQPIGPIDPLFLTPGAKFYCSEAQGFPSLEFDVKDKLDTGETGLVKVRYSLLDPQFFSEKYAPPESKAAVKGRQAIMKEYHGMIVLRQGRQIDVVRYPREWQLSLTNNDRFWKIEIDFPAQLDGEFSVTTSKQQINISDRIWELLRENGVLRAAKTMRAEAGKKLLKLAADKQDNKDGKQRASEQAMREVEKFKVRPSASTTPQRIQEAEETLKEFAERKARIAGIPHEIIEEQFRTEEKERPYKVETESHPNAPFFRVVQRGGQVVLLINEGHAFYTDVYAAGDTTPRMRSGLEVLLFSIGVSELEATDDRRTFYESERIEWSRVLNTALDRLQTITESDFDHDDDGDTPYADGKTAA